MKKQFLINSIGLVLSRLAFSGRRRRRLLRLPLRMALGHQRNGHLLQGRFGAVLVQDDAGWQQVARYVHLNPVRVARLKLDKSARAASHAGLVSRSDEQVSPVTSKGTTLGRNRSLLGFKIPHLGFSV